MLAQRFALCALASVGIFLVGCADTPQFVSNDGGGGTTRDSGNRQSSEWYDPGVTRPSCAGQEAEITGIVLAPNGKDPVPGATVFVPSATPELFPPEVRCEVCGSLGTGYNFWTATSGPDGRFKLAGVCPGEVNVVMQNGRFRRLVRVNVPASGSVELTSEQSRLPRRTGEFGPFDAIPRIAVATGDFDKMECVLRKMGIERFDLFEASKYLNSPAPNTLIPFSALVGDLSKMLAYNVIFINCTDDVFEAELSKAKVRENISAYVKAGGRFYVTDWSYDWVEQIETMSKYIDFEPGDSSDAPEPHNAATTGAGGLKVDGIIKDATLAKWLGNFPGAVRTVGGESVTPIEHFLGKWVVMRKSHKDSQVWVEGKVSSLRSEPGYFTDETRPLTVTFKFENCGKVLFTSYHTKGRDDQYLEDFFGGVRPNPMPFPQYCQNDELSPQERILEFLIFDIARCVKPIG